MVTGAGQVQLVVPAQTPTTTAETTDTGPSPIAPEVKELIWGAGAFIVLAILMRLVLFPRVKKGMDARYGMIRDELESADATRAEAQAEMAEYEAELARVRAEASDRIDAARQTLESERHARLTEVNARISEQRAAAAAAGEAAKAAAREQIVTAAGNVAASAAERAIGRPVDQSVARAHVETALSAGASA
jgi:F-type H+-transporting ATPase subunit b